MARTVNPSFSIITPCYRGSAFLPKAFRSLLEQKGQHIIEWIIVDDFSNDENKTMNCLREIKNKAPFPVKIILLDKNYYCSKSTYTGACNASNKYCIILDQDDALMDNALDIFSEKLKMYGGGVDFAGVCGRCVNLDGQLIGTPFSFHGKLSNELYIRHIDKIRGELFQCTKTELVSEYFNGMKPGYTNGWAWSRIASKYQYFYIDDVVRIYDTANPTSTSNMKQLIYLDAKLEQLTEYLVHNKDYLKSDRICCARLLVQWSRIGLHQKKRIKEQLKLLPNFYHKMLTLVYLIAVIKVKVDIIKCST